MSRRSLYCTAVALLAAALIAAGAAPSLAQGEPPLSEVLLPKDGAAVVDSPLGRAEVASFAEALQASADPACKDSRKLDAEQYRTQARGLFLHYFPNVRKYMSDRINSQGFKVDFEQGLGQGSLAEWRGMLKQPDMRKRLAILAPRADTWVVNELSVQIYRTDLIAGRAIKKAFGALQTGDPASAKIEAQLYDDADAKLKALDKGKRSKAAARFDDMFDAAGLAMIRASKHEPPSSAWLNMAPKDIIPDLPARLEAVCVKR